MLVSATPPLLALGFLTTIKGSFPPRARLSSSSLARVCKRNLSKSTNLYLINWKLSWNLLTGSTSSSELQNLKAEYTYLENISSSVLVLGLAKVNIFQLILTELRSVIFTSLMEVGQGSIIKKKVIFQISSTILLKNQKIPANW